MAISEKEKQAYLAEIEPTINAAVDVAMVRHTGWTWREDEVVPRRATLAHGEQNGSARPQDSLEQIRQDFPQLFGKADAP